MGETAILNLVFDRSGKEASMSSPTPGTPRVLSIYNYYNYDSITHSFLSSNPRSFLSSPPSLFPASPNETYLQSNCCQDEKGLEVLRLPRR